MSRHLFQIFNFFHSPSLRPLGAGNVYTFFWRQSPPLPFPLASPPRFGRKSRIIEKRCRFLGITGEGNAWVPEKWFPVFKWDFHRAFPDSFPRVLSCALPLPTRRMFRAFFLRQKETPGWNYGRKKVSSLKNKRKNFAIPSKIFCLPRRGKGKFD